MAERPIRIFGDPVLKTVCDPVVDIDDRVRGLVTDLIDSVRIPGRAGVAANQIGVASRVFSYNVDGVVAVVINPEIVELSGDPVLTDEGCLSVPDLWFPVMRYPHAVVRGLDVHGDEIVVEGDGLLAQALQHETDHLDGKVYLDRLDRDRRREALRAVRESSWF